MEITIIFYPSKIFHSPNQSELKLFRRLVYQTLIPNTMAIASNIIIYQISKTMFAFLQTLKIIKIVLNINM